MNVQVSVSFCTSQCSKVTIVIVYFYLPAKKKKKKSYEYKFYHTENPTPQPAIDEHTKNYTEISKYLAMPHTDNIKDVGQVHGFPAVKNLHKKFNAIMPSEADVERLFSIGGTLLLWLLLLFFTFNALCALCDCGFSYNKQKKVYILFVRKS